MILRLWELSNAGISREFRGHTNPIGDIRFISSGQKIASASSDGFRVWDRNSGELLVTFIVSADDEWLAITLEGFFDSSPNAAKGLGIVQGKEVFSIDLFYDRLHRPDLVQQRFAGDPLGKVKATEPDINIAKVLASGAAPKVSILSPSDGISVEANEVLVKVRVADQGGGISKVEWRVNDMVLGLDTTDNAKSQPELTLNRSLSLYPGVNQIEVIAYNAQGQISSEPASTSVKLLPKQSSDPPELYILSVGINDYWDSKLRLNFAVPDARAIAEGMKRAGKNPYGKITVRTMLDPEVTCPSSDDLRLIRHYAKGGSGSSGVRV